MFQTSEQFKWFWIKVQTSDRPCGTFFFTCSEKYVSWLHHRVNITGCIYAELGGRAHCIHGTHNCILWFSCDGSVLACLHQHHHKCD